MLLSYSGEELHFLYLSQYGKPPSLSQIAVGHKLAGQANVEVKVKKVLSLHVTKAGNAAEVLTTLHAFIFQLCQGKEWRVLLYPLRKT